MQPGELQHLGQVEPVRLLKEITGVEMVALNLGINPLDWFDDSADKAYASAEHQRIVDNRFRNRQFQESDKRYRTGLQREDNRLQRLMMDARKAGISPLAALGAGGASPANITVPVGQGGRAAGRYQRKSGLEASISANVIKQSEINTQAEFYRKELLRMQAQNAYYDWQRKLDRDFLDPVTGKDFYTRWNWNYDQAQKWHQEGYVVLPDPQSGIEMPETLGLGYWTAPRAGSPGPQNSWLGF